jgi:hypothetical protein
LDVKSSLILCEPINFHNICDIYPIEIKDYIKDSDKFNNLYLPYVISKDILAEELQKYSVFEIIIANDEYMETLYKSLIIFCKTENIKMKINTNGEPELYFNENLCSLNKNNFDEFADIILLSGGKEKYKAEVIPVFETAEGYERWKKYEEMKQKYAKKDDASVANIINVAQSGGLSYINENTIKHWSMWKLMNTYSSIINKDGYEKQYSQYLVTGKTDGIKEHWSDLLKVK